MPSSIHQPISPKVRSWQIEDRPEAIHLADFQTITRRIILCEHGMPLIHYKHAIPDGTREVHADELINERVFGPQLLIGNIWTGEGTAPR